VASADVLGAMQDLITAEEPRLSKLSQKNTTISTRAMMMHLA